MYGDCDCAKRSGPVVRAWFVYFVAMIAHGHYNKRFNFTVPPLMFQTLDVLQRP
jgi:hypothetical protein